MESISPSVRDTYETSVSLVHLWLLTEDIFETGVVYYNGADDGYRSFGQVVLLDLIVRLSR